MYTFIQGPRELYALDVLYVDCLHRVYVNNNAFLYWQNTNVIRMQLGLSPWKCAVLSSL